MFLSFCDYLSEHGGEKSKDTNAQVNEALAERLFNLITHTQKKQVSIESDLEECRASVRDHQLEGLKQTELMRHGEVRKVTGI